MAIKSAFEHVVVPGGLSERNLKAYRTMSAVSNAASNVKDSIGNQVKNQVRENAQENTVDKETSKVIRSSAIYAVPVLTATVGSVMAVENYKRAMQRNFDAVKNLDGNASKLSQKLAEAGMVRNPDMTNEGLNSVFGNGSGPTVISAGGDTMSPIGRMTQFNDGYTVTEIDMQGFAMKKKIDVGISFDTSGKIPKLVLSGPKITLDESTKDYVKISAVSPKGEASVITQLTDAKRNEIANNLKGFEKNVWGKFEPSSLGKNRDAFHYKVDGTILRVTNMNGEAKAAAEMYTNLLRYNKRRSRIDGTDFLDEKLKKQVKELRDAAKNLDKAKKQLKGIPKKLGRRSLRILTKELEQSDAAKGYRLGRSMVGGARTVIKAGTPIGVGVSRFAVNYLYNGTAKLSNVILKKLGKDFKIPVFKDGLTTVLRRRITLMRARGKATVKAIGAALLNATPLGNTVFGQKITNRIAISIAKDFGLDKALAKTALKAANKAVGKGVVGKAVEKAAQKAANTAVGKVVGKVGKFAGKAITGATNVVLAPFRFLGRALNAFKRAFGFILKKIILPILAVWALLLLLEMFFMMLLGLFTAQSDEESLANMYTASKVTEWNEKSKLVIDTLHSCHEDQMAELKELAGKYEVADIQYPAGEQENYKELFCGILVTCQYDISFFTPAELKDIANNLYERTHIVTEVPYNIGNYDGSVSENNACHIFLDVQRDTALAYAIMDQSDDANIDMANIVSGECASDDWLQVVSTMKSLVYANKKAYPAGKFVYYTNDKGNPSDMGKGCTVVFNGQSIKVRQDCSGYVSACLQAYGAWPIDSTKTAAGIADTSSIPGFTKIRFTSWYNLIPGDIVAGTDHTEIFAYYDGKTPYVYNCGSDSSLTKPGESVSGRNKNMTTIWRPMEAGTLTGSTGAVDEDGNPITDVVINNYTPGDEIWPYGFWCSEDDITLPFSNNAAVEFSDEDGNQVGYEDALVASIQSELDSTKYFTNANYIQSTDAHMIVQSTGTTTQINSIDFIRYICAKHSVMIPMQKEDFYEGLEQGSMKDLKVGDIIAYATHTGDADAIAEKIPIYKLNGGIPEVEGLDDPMSALYQSIIPMIYIGNGQAVGYGRDALATTPSTAGAQIRTYNVSELDRKRVYEVIRPYGYTIASTYGSTEYFEGWTDMNIARFYVFMNDSCWDTGSKVIDVDEDAMGVTADENGTYTIDYSFYNKKQDMFNGNDVYYTSDHTDTFMDDMINELIRLYDERGILPSIGYTKAYALSNNRTTEESLIGYNVFEILSDNAGLNAITEKYSYDGNGESTINTKEYEKYTSLKNAIIDLHINLQGKNDLFVNDKSTDPAGSFTRDLNKWLANGDVTSNEVTKMQDRYNQVADQLQAADTMAIRIKEIEDELNSMNWNLANTIGASAASNFHEDNGGIDYSSSCDEVKKAINDYNELVSMINFYHDNNVGRSIYTTNIKTRLNTANESITKAMNTLNAAYDYHASHADSESYCKYETTEYTPTYLDPFTGELKGGEAYTAHHYESWSKVTFATLQSVTEAQ